MPLLGVNHHDVIEGYSSIDRCHRVACLVPKHVLLPAVSRTDQIAGHVQFRLRAAAWIVSSGADDRVGGNHFGVKFACELAGVLNSTRQPRPSVETMMSPSTAVSARTPSIAGLGTNRQYLTGEEGIRPNHLRLARPPHLE